jgi:hypothetical protein
MDAAGAGAPDPLPVTVHLAASALAIRATLLVLTYVPLLLQGRPGSADSTAWSWDYLVWAAIFGVLAYGLWSRSPRAWSWAVAGLALRLASWVAWSGFYHQESPAKWSASSWFGLHAVEPLAWMLGPLVLLLLPASRRALADPSGAVAAAGGSARLPIAVHVAASALAIRAAFMILDLPAQLSWQGIDIAPSILRIVVDVGMAVVFLKLARGLWERQSSARTWLLRILPVLLIGYVAYAFYFQHSNPGHLTYADWFSWNEIRNRVWIYGPLVLLLLPSSRRAFASPA